MAGRPLTLTPEVHALLVEAASEGLTFELMAGYARVDERTMYRWLARGRRGEEPYAALCQDIMHARAKDAFWCAQKVKAGGKGMLGAQWKLVYQYKFSQKTETEVHVSEGGDLADDELAAWLAKKATRLQLEAEPEDG